MLTEELKQNIITTIIIIWVIGGIIAFIYSLMCFGYESSILEKIIGLLLAVFTGPLYFIYYSFNKNYCKIKITETNISNSTNNNPKISNSINNNNLKISNSINNNNLKISNSTNNEQQRMNNRRNNNSTNNNNRRNNNSTNRITNNNRRIEK